ncbi:type II toxin-antitoxin system PemK/MazF family toxin [Bosea sp. (in: a-proteobacteria)]|jgi:mRNA interferase MazF|uniref:type II toxin-antitoxin system PemK/MazF family toxin n=1 Tax=Bosea sp. (in: a-proteobacteria) TaxID=1871050 RepID=UPI00086B0552|nr:type II toxin-antitoxin system PemK/MazF family toxin [Bosea sp. (in: a-proteobacteria)]MBN9436864.1 type II toxin-antitoxin system PemK/MazF family toxin [Bosea sp. (in: a-proteobacteria)]ODT44749.1 MAG: growth inhibitor PemK [Methylobacterium sp. SCN 67-24]
MVKRGEIWLVTLDPTVGSEIQKTRPCLVISPAEIHDHLRTVIVAPMTSGSRPAGFRIPVRFDGVDGLILLEQSRALDKRRLLKRLGQVPEETLAQVLRTLRELYED